mmetsp:Transcript_30980/g.89523  ORF Transcript_30980/g.89523 Transcript_30980/m.89523 type:complete len:261 (-) Transcript_30980:818-1600(-)
MSFVFAALWPQAAPTAPTLVCGCRRVEPPRLAARPGEKAMHMLRVRNAPRLARPPSGPLAGGAQGVEPGVHPRSRPPNTSSAGGCWGRRSSGRPPVTPAGVAPVPDARGPGALRWPGEGHAPALREDHRLVRVRNALMHNRAVPVTSDVGLETLVRSAPTHSAHLAAGQDPLRVAVKGAPEARHKWGLDHVDEGITQACSGVEVGGQVDEVVASGEALAVEHGQQHVTSVIVRDIPQHDRCAICQRHLRLLLPVFDRERL